MGKKFALAIAMAGITLLAGCATAGNEKLGEATGASLSKTLTKGVTTKTQVEAALGQPTNVSFNSGQEQWTYNFAHATPTAVDFVPVVNLFVHHADVHRKELVVLFNKKDVVQNYAFTDGESVVKSGVGQ
ncbi:SmpA / OmlA family protein [mine drainage metagenome]|jgi:outer membrane protein assembly factor BamE (lipoprotein component of BamABCDE complex)|uniref:SmpA / OmlA family protein n=1 Tax=mine drainage metagenome TaxID=410659 RepID=A0A1J5SV22_9ZZZZ